MADRSVKDSAGRTWTCSPAAPNGASQGKDVLLMCLTPSLPEPVRITVGWQWETMSPNGLARLIAQAAPAPHK